MDKTWKYYAKWKKSVKTPHIKCFYLYEMSRVGENIKTETHIKITSQKLSSEIQVLKSNCTPKAQDVQEIFILFFMPIGKQDTPELCTKAFSSTTTKDTQPRWKVQICLNFLESPWNVGSDSRDFTWSSLPHPQGSDLHLLLLVLTLCPLAEFIYRAYN